jgi:plastocyanin
MSKEGDLPKLPIKKRKIGTIGGSLIVMGLSLLFIYILWASFGHIGPSFSSDVLNLQQSTLRAQYHLPEKPVITDPTVLQTPPSLRPFLTDNATSGSTNATSGSTNATSGSTNATSGSTNATSGSTNATSGSTNATSGSTNATSGSTNATSGLTDQASGNTQVSIVAGASTLTDRAFSPNVIEITVGQTVVWTNDDNAFHTVTSGAAGDAEAGKEFDSGLTGPTALTSKGKTFEHTFDRIGDYPYFCSLHPAMVGTVIVK